MLLQTGYKNQIPTVFNPNATRFMPQAQQQQQQQQQINKREEADLSFFDTEKLLKFATSQFENHHENEMKLPSYVEMAWNSVDQQQQQQQQYFDCSNRELHWMHDISIGININNIISAANSPSTQDDNASSSSSLMSRSSDSGFRSTLFNGEEETTKQTNIQSISTAPIIINKHFTDVLSSRCDTPLDGTSSSISEHLEFTYSHTTTTENNNINNKLNLKNAQIQSWNSKVADSVAAGVSVVNSDTAVDSDDEVDDDCDSRSCVSSSDTSDDASVIDEDFNNDAAVVVVDVIKTQEDFNSINYYNMHSTHTSTKYTQQLIKDVESFMKKSLDIGIYSCMNKTDSFFVESEDILRPLGQEDYNEYQLFPMMEARFVDSYPEFF